MKEAAMEESTRLVYIMGRGRSGSTVLAELLGHADDLQNVGELVSRMTGACGCGEPFSECGFWQQVQTAYERKAGANWERDRTLLQKQAYLPHFPSTWLARRNEATVQELRTINLAFIDAITNVASKTAVVDASKELTRALFLMRHLPDTKFVHIVRRPESTVASYRDRIKRGNIRFLRREYRSGFLDCLFLALIASSWVVGNLLAELIRLLSPARVLRVRHEDLCENPVRELRRLEKFLEFSLSTLIDTVEQERPMQVGHIIAGSYRMRSGTFILERTTNKGVHLPWLYRIMVRAIAWPLMLVYGY
jgi:hypothetical protein